MALESMINWAFSRVQFLPMSRKTIDSALNGLDSTFMDRVIDSIFHGLF